ncbi:MAG: PQQ-binding-like beta-propeller repeat protein, partial [Caldiserica bacterium]|nr:PQQ-binding-like beta-propeller repeat protein [Caldisericota bacterium]
DCKNSDGDKIAGVASSPTIDGDKVYFGTICGKIMCLDAKKGQKNWQFTPNNASFNTPVVFYGNNLMAVSSDELLRCVDPSNGKLKWSINCKGNLMSPPAVEKGIAYLPYDKGIICYDIDKKTEINKGKLVNESFLLTGTPAVKDGRVYYGSILSSFECYDATTGSKKWTGPFMITSAPCITNDSVYVGALGGLYCLSKDNGTTRWQFENKGIISGSPVACGERIYFGTSEGDFYCISPSGKVLFKYNEGSSINDTIICSNNLVYFATGDGKLFCLAEEGYKSKPAKIILTAEKSRIGTGQTIKIRANAFDFENKDVETKDIVWTLDPKDMGTITADGLFTAGSTTGKISITGCLGGICDTIEVDIVDISEFISKIEVKPDGATATVGIPIKFEATAYDKYARVAESTRFTWSVEPKDAGKFDNNGTFTPESTGDCTVTASVGKISGSAKLTIIKVSSLVVEPTQVTINYGLTKQFKVTVKDNNDKIVENPALTFACSPAGLGAIDATGLFTAGNTDLEGTVTVSGYGLTATANVKVEELKQAKIETKNTEVVFENIDPGKSLSSVITIGNSGNIPGDITATTDSDWILLSPKTGTVEPGKTIDVTVMLKSSALKKNAKLNGKVTIKSSAPDPIIIPVKVTVSAGADCYELNTALDFQTVSRGTTKTMTKTITFIGNQKGTLKPSVPWITVKPDTFDKVKQLDVVVTVTASAMPSGESFEGEIAIIGSDLCKDTKISVTVKTEKDIQIKLVLNSKNGLINRNNTVLDVPPQVIKGNTMVPLRFIAEAFGCKVGWNGSEKKITITRGSFEMMLWMDKTTAKVNGQSKTMKAPPTSVKGSTLVPLRFIAEAFGATVNFNSKTQEIDILWAPY